jgi:GNAT superfamily N-acetyltransferase
MSLSTGGVSDAASPTRVGDSASTPSRARTLELQLGTRLAVSIRAVEVADEAALLKFLGGLSLGSRRLRFFSAAVNLRAEAHRGAAADDVDHHGVLALASGRGVVGHAIYVRAPGQDRAEVAVEVADDLHRLGLATHLLIELAQLAENRQITRFFAEVLPENRDMLSIFCAGFGAQTVVRRDEVDIEFATSNWRQAQAGIER